MELSLSQAAEYMGIPERTLRSKLARGELAGHKQNGRWMVHSKALPLNEAQRRAMLERAQAVRGMVEELLPGALADHETDRRRSLADFRSFSAGARLLAEMAAAPPSPSLDRARLVLEEALLALAEGFHEYNGGARIAALTRARAGMARAEALLCLGSLTLAEPGRSWASAIERELLPPLAGLFRRAEQGHRPEPGREWRRR